MITSRDCWWTRHRQSEITDAAGKLIGAGCPREVLEHAAGLLSTSFHTGPSHTGDYDEVISLGAFAGGTSHDDCFFELGPRAEDLTRAMVEAVLALHGTYLGRAVDWSPIVNEILDRLRPEFTVRMRSRPEKQVLEVRAYPRDASFMNRALTKAMILDCSGSKARVA